MQERLASGPQGDKPPKLELAGETRLSRVLTLCGASRSAQLYGRQASIVRSGAHLSNVLQARPAVQPSRSQLFVRGQLRCSPVEHAPMASVSGSVPTVADEKRGRVLLLRPAQRG